MSRDPERQLNPEQRNEFQAALANLRKTGNGMLTNANDKEQQVSDLSRYELISRNTTKLRMAWLASRTLLRMEMLLSSRHSCATWLAMSEICPTK